MQMHNMGAIAMSRTTLLAGVDVFVEVVNARSFSRAAARLGMPATTVSARIRRLEDRLGTALLQRTTRRLSLTDAGERYYALCVDAIDLVQQAERAVATTLDEPRGRLRITAPADIAQSMLVPVIASYLDRFPAVTVELEVSNTYRDLVGEGIDLAIRVGELRSSSLVVRRFFTSALGLFAAPEYLAAHPAIERLSDLGRHRLIRIRTGRRGLVLRDGDESFDIDAMMARLQVDDMVTCQAFARSGLGIGLLPLFGQPEADRTAQLVQILPQVRIAPFTAHFLYPRQNLVPPTVRSFIDMALASIAATPSPA